jgi:hypothetical protein
MGQTYIKEESPMSLGRDHYNPGKDVPKLVRCNAGRDEAAMYKNLGNSQRIKFLWVESVTISGTEELILDLTDYGAGKSVTAPDHYAPGGGFYGKTPADLHYWPVPLAAPAGVLYVDIDDTVGAEKATLKSTASETNLEVEVLIFSS